MNTAFEARILVVVNEISGSYLALNADNPILENDPILISATQGEIKELEGIYLKID